jgi:HemY protein
MPILKLAGWIIGLSAIGIVAAELADHPGHVVLRWQDYEMETTVVVLLCATLLTFAIGAGIFRTFIWVMGTPKRWVTNSSAKKQEQGLQALTEAFAAMALSDYSFARKQTERAQKLLSDSPLSLMFAAQLARMEGDEGKTRHYLEKMLENEQTKFVATRGLVETYRRRGDFRQAIEQAQRAYDMRPQDKWVATTLIDLLSRQYRWQEALRTAEKSYKKRIITNAEFQRIWCIIHYENGKKLAEAKEWHNAQTFLQTALKKQPGFVPAAVLLASTYHTENKPESGFRMLATAWKHSPHPDLASAVHQLFANDVASKRAKRIEKLVASQPEHIESLVALGDAALQAGELIKAKSLLTLAYSKEESVRICRMMAELCQRDPSLQHEASDWLIRAGAASSNPIWTCKNCANTSAQWDSRCYSCGTFDSYEWTRRLPIFSAITSTYTD